MKRAFTLVELIVVITILAILSIIGFISYNGYGVTSRDSVRISNVNDLQKSLEVRKSQAGEYPEPDNSYSVKYLGKEVWKQGTIGDTTKKHIKFQSTEMDPKYANDYSYSVSADGKTFEVGTIMEDELNNSFGFLSTNVFAEVSEKALNFGSLSGKFKSVKVNGETHIFSVPSMTLNSFKNGDGSDFGIIVDLASDNFSVTGESSIPESYVAESESINTTSFTPRLLYRGDNCGVETDQEIVNFIAILRDSFNQEPFLSNPEYLDIFTDYEILRNNMENFETLQKLGLKINKQLGCNITNFKTTDIFPTKCGYEQLDFENVDDGFDIATKSCLFSYSGNGSATVKNGEGNFGTKGLNINFNENYQRGEFSYRVFSYKATKFNFDIKSTEFTGISDLEFYINGNRYIHKIAGDDYSGGFERYSTPLLPPGLYDFEWKIYSHASNRLDIWLDNLNFTCIGGGTGCGWSLGFETGNYDPNEMFTFEGDVNMPWLLTDDATEGNFAIVNPLIPTSGNTSISYTKTLDEISRLSFDYKIWDHHDGWVRLYIDGVEYKQWGWGNRGDPLQTIYGTYLTAPLSVGEHTIKLTVYRNWNTGHKTFLYLDNFQTYCEEGDTGCGMDLGFENSDIDTKGYFSFDGDTTTPWGLETEPENVSDGVYSMRSPSISTNGKSYMYYHKDYDEPAKISFDYKLEQAGSWAKFYIDDVEYDYIGYGGRNPGTGFNTFTTPLLTGKHELKIEIFRNWNSGIWGHYIYLYLDNFTVSCLGGVTVTGNENCGWTEGTFENGFNNPWELFEFTGGINIPWPITEGSGGTIGIKSPKSKTSTHSYMKFNKTVTEGQELKFDFKLKTSCGGSTALKMNGTQLVKWSYGGITAPVEYEEYSTGPLSAGTYNFEFDVYRNWNTCSYADFYLDNLRVE